MNKFVRRFFSLSGGDLDGVVAIINAIFIIKINIIINFIIMTIIMVITIGGDLKGVAPLSPGDSARLVESDRALGLSV